ncbi:acid ceramidase-like [Ptychodera flava]|uniref:acid ceramidase-like n=1 Tax=Ptychodera flava TaxID=63121 RepID=UPI003969E69A
MKYLWLSLVIAVIQVTYSQGPPFTEDCRNDMYPPKPETKVPTYVVNLDADPKDRWKEVVTDKTEEFKYMLTVVKNLTGSFFQGSLIDFIDKNFPSIVSGLPAPYGDEIIGIAAATGIPLGEVVLYNVFYELFTLCTSIIGEDPNGKLYHARNLDFGLFLGWDIGNDTWWMSEALRPLVVNIDYQRGGKTVYQAVHFTGYVGILTGIKPHVFTVTMNERFNIDGGYIGFIEWVLGKRDAKWVGFITRDAMESCNSYSEAMDLLANHKVLAPAYFILGGNQSGEGAVITRDRNKAVDVWHMNDTGHPWFILETNYDHWKAPLFLDDRRTPATKCMNKLTQQNVGIAGIFNVLNTKPMLNKLTTYTAVMQVNSGHLETYLRYCPTPCWPF